MNESRDSPARRKQYLVICTVMAVFFVHALVTSGALLSFTFGVKEFDGGIFVYKYTTRDYAASMALLRSVAEDAGIEKDEYEDVMYSLYLDNPMQMGGMRQRFASGIIFKEEEMEQKLLDLNDDTEPALSQEEQQENPVEPLIPKLKYQSANLPKVKMAVVNFPFTNGFVSALVLSYKVIPAIRKYSAKHGEPGSTPIVLTTCSVKQEMCTHYAPLEPAAAYLLGQPDSDTYLKSMPKEKVLDWRHIWEGTKKKYGKHIMGFGSKEEEKTSSTKKEEL